MLLGLHPVHFGKEDLHFEMKEDVDAVEPSVSDVPQPECC